MTMHGKRSKRSSSAFSRTVLGLAVAALVLLIMNGGCMSVEEARYDVLRQDGEFELRAYAPRVVAETVVDASLEDAGNQAFRKLFRYISGGNRGRDKIAMTAPVAQEAAPEKIAMTAPVAQEAAGAGWRVSFMMPSGRTLADLPAPEDPDVTLRDIPAGTMAAVRYSGTWGERRYRQHLRALELWLEAQSLQAAGNPVWARYNPPFTPWFLRRNEILVPVVLDPAPAPDGGMPAP